jgi:hypothetical protein
MISGKHNPKFAASTISEMTPEIDSKKSRSPDVLQDGRPQNGRKDSRLPSTKLDDGAEVMIMIKQTYNFAGKVHSVEKLVPKNSAEAALFLSSQTTAEHPREDTSSPFVRAKRPTKKARRSVFEPNSDLPLRTDLHFGVRRDSDLVIVGLAGKDAKKLNTVEKSAMDWAGFVDKEGIKDELDAAGKSKGAYRARQEFLARVEQKKEEDARRSRGLPS